MVAGGIKLPRVLDELESHLRDDVEQQMGSGLSAQRAFESAVKRIGQAAALSSEFDRMGNQSVEMFRRHTLRRACAIGAGLFIVGASLCYFMVMPAAMHANKQYISWLGIESPNWPITAHIGFVCKLMFGVGLGFAMPVALAALVTLGVFDYRKLVGMRRYVIVLNFILGALMTTPEVVTQLLMFIPLQLVYELGVCLAWHSRRKETKPA